ncbi:MAG: hypothetical protein MSG64_16935 [Pyrinomonadaceae bacterium MAG19_C2-C3]|nr:hypothetical protein [Pyrinomonadaceae bacterium MAG19_C2-C3]
MRKLFALPALLLALSLVSASSFLMPESSRVNTLGSVASAAQSTDPPRCGTQDVSSTKARQIQQAMSVDQEATDPERAAGTVYIPVVFHVITSSTGEGNVSESQLDAQIDILNNAFNGATGGADTPYRFFKRQVTTRTVNDRWFSVLRLG